MNNPSTKIDFPLNLENDHIAHEPGKSFDIIAKLNLVRIYPDGKQAPITFTIASPYLTLDGFWRVPMLVTGYGEPSPEIYAVDSLQALYAAIEKIKNIITALEAKGNKFSDNAGDTFSVKEYFKAMQ